MLRLLEEKKMLSTFEIVIVFCVDASANKNTPSANNVCEMRGPFLVIEIGNQLD